MATHEIIIKRPPIDGNGEGLSPPASSSGVSTQRNRSVSGVSGGNQTAGAWQSASTKVAAQALQSVAQVYMAQRTTEINVLTGSTQYAQRQAAINSAVSAGVNLASGAIQGASVLSMLGIATGGTGLAIGLALSAATTVISKVTDYQKAKDEINISYQAESQQLDYLRSRAGPFYNQSR